MISLNRRPVSPIARLVVGSVVGAAVLGGLAACGGSKGSSAPAPSVSVPQSVPASPTETITPEPTSPINGMPMSGSGRAVLAIKIDNTQSALPHMGLTSADLVYVEQVEGGLTRIAAIFSSKLPAAVAPIRSARETDAELLPTYGNIPVAFSGSVARVHAMIAAAGLVDVSEDKGGEGYYRLSSRYAPYNLAGTPKVLIKRGGSPVLPQDIGLVFGDVPTGGRAATSITERFPSARIGFTYNKATNRWVYSLNGETDQMPGMSPASASTVIIQYVEIGSAGRGDKLRNNVPFTHTVGSGKGLVARDGRVFPVRWSRKTVDGPTTYTRGGKPFPMGAGQPWVVLAPRTTPATFN